MTKIADTIYWTYNNPVWLSEVAQHRPSWRTDQNGDVVIIGWEPDFPRHYIGGSRMTVEDMDACDKCIRCDAFGNLLQTVAKELQ